MAGFLAGECLCEAASVTESVVDRAVRVAEEKQQNALNTKQPSHGQFTVIIIVIDAISALAHLYISLTRFYRGVA